MPDPRHDGPPPEPASPATKRQPGDPPIYGGEWGGGGARSPGVPRSDRPNRIKTSKDKP